MDVSPKSEIRRVRCKNCTRRFVARAKGGSPQLFCTDACRKEFHRNGAAFGKLRDKLPGYIAAEAKKYFQENYVTREYFWRVIRAVRAECAAARVASIARPESAPSNSGAILSEVQAREIAKQ